MSVALKPVTLIVICETPFLCFAAFNDSWPAARLKRVIKGTSLCQTATRPLVSRSRHLSTFRQHLLVFSVAGDETAEQKVHSQQPAATAQVGPQTDDAPGRFAHLVEEAIFVSSEDGNGVSTGGLKARKSPGSPSRRQAALQPLKRGLYDHLPPPEKAKS